MKSLITKRKAFIGLKAILLSIVIYAIYINIFDIVKIPIPVKYATSANWSKDSYWYRSADGAILHKGIDIFSPQKTPIISPVSGIVLLKGYSNNGGNYIYILSTGLRVYYFAHLNTINVTSFKYVTRFYEIGTVGNTGNALSKPYHLHFSIFSIMPIVKYFDATHASGWKKAFYLDPNRYLIK